MADLKLLRRVIISDGWLVECAVHAYRHELNFMRGFDDWWHISKGNWSVSVRENYVRAGGALPLSADQIHDEILSVAKREDFYLMIQKADVEKQLGQGRFVVEFPNG